jgi:hypothetical protein
VDNNSRFVEHTNNPVGCRREEIQEIAESADHEYYMSAPGPQNGVRRERAKRGRERIEKYIDDLKKLRVTVLCGACQSEIERQLELQRKGLREIDHVWGNSLATE